MTFCHLNLHFLTFFTMWQLFSSKFAFFDEVCFYVLRLRKYELMRASSYLPLLKELKAKQGCLNIHNNDEKCFLMSILALLHPVQCRIHPDRVTKYQEYESELNMSGIQYPVDIKILTNSNIKTTLWVRRYKNLSLTYYHHDHCKSSCKFVIYHCRWNISLRIAERLEQIDIKTK